MKATKALAVIALLASGIVSTDDHGANREHFADTAISVQA